MPNITAVKLVKEIEKELNDFYSYSPGIKQIIERFMDKMEPSISRISRKEKEKFKTKTGQDIQSYIETKLHNAKKAILIIDEAIYNEKNLKIEYQNSKGEIDTIDVTPIYSGPVQKFKAEFPGLRANVVVTGEQDVFKYTSILKIEIMEPGETQQGELF
jgi:hypothetical protein